MQNYGVKMCHLTDLIAEIISTLLPTQDHTKNNQIEIHTTPEEGLFFIVILNLLQQCMYYFLRDTFETVQTETIQTIDRI